MSGHGMLKYFHPITHKKDAPEDKDPPEGKELSNLSRPSGLKVGQMTQTIWVTWVTFLVGQVGLIHKLNYLDVTRIFNRSHVL